MWDPWTRNPLKFASVLIKSSKFSQKGFTAEANCGFPSKLFGYNNNFKDSFKEKSKVKHKYMNKKPGLGN